MNKINELVSEVKLEKLGTDILAEIAGFNQDEVFEYLDVQIVDKSVLSNIADSMITNHTEQLVDFLLWKHSYKDQIEDNTYNSMLDAVTYNLSGDSSNYIWDINSEKYLLKIPEESTATNLEFIERIFEFIFNYYSDSPYMFVKNKDTNLDLDNEDDKSLYLKILTISNLETDISKVDDDTLKYRIAPAINEYLEDKGYVFDKDENKYYIPIDDDKKYSIMKDIIERNFISYSENEHGFIVSTKDGKKELYIDSCSQYTVSDECTAYHFNEVSEFLAFLDSISVKRVSYTDMNNMILKKALDDNGISYKLNNDDEIIINTTSGPAELYVDTEGLYCLEDYEGIGIARHDIESFTKYVKAVYIEDKMDLNLDNLSKDDDYVTLECTTRYCSKHRWVLQETRTFDDAKTGGMIDSHLQILDLNHCMRFVSDEELNRLGYDDVWDVDWVITNQSSNKIAN